MNNVKSNILNVILNTVMQRNGIRWMWQHVIESEYMDINLYRWFHNEMDGIWTSMEFKGLIEQTLEDEQ